MTADPTNRTDREYLTRIDIQIDWIDAYEGRYIPLVEVSGDIPDNLSITKLAQYFVEAANRAMKNPALATDGSAMNAEGFME